MLNVRKDENWQNRTENFVHLEKKSVKDLPIWNSIRLDVFKEIKKGFLDNIIEKGQIKSTYKELLTKNQNYLENFFQKKVRDLVEEIFSSENFSKDIKQINDLLEEQTKSYFLQDFSALNYEEKLIHIKKINDNLLELIKRECVKRISKLILTENYYKQKIVDYLNEFLNFLIIF
ncbi:MAG: hypothetical protein ACFFDW_16800 [Candidatus Thorarchaeota archaeon]